MRAISPARELHQYDHHRESGEDPLSLQGSHSSESIPGALGYGGFPNWEIHRRSNQRWSRGVFLARAVMGQEYRIYDRPSFDGSIVG